MCVRAHARAIARAHSRAGLSGEGVGLASPASLRSGHWAGWAKVRHRNPTFATGLVVYDCCAVNGRTLPCNHTVVVATHAGKTRLCQGLVLQQSVRHTLSAAACFHPPGSRQLYAEYPLVDWISCPSPSFGRLPAILSGPHRCRPAHRCSSARSSFSRSQSVGCTAYSPRPRRWSTLSTPSTKYAGYAEHQVRRVRLAILLLRQYDTPFEDPKTIEEFASFAHPNIWPERAFGRTACVVVCCALYADVACCVLCTAYVVRMSYMRHDACSAVIA